MELETEEWRSRHVVFPREWIGNRGNGEWRIWNRGSLGSGVVVCRSVVGFRFIDAPEGADYLATDEAFNYSNLAWQALVDCLVFLHLHFDIFLEFHLHVPLLLRSRVWFWFWFWFLAALFSFISLCSYVTWLKNADRQLVSGKSPFPLIIIRSRGHWACLEVQGSSRWCNRDAPKTFKIGANIWPALGHRGLIKKHEPKASTNTGFPTFDSSATRELSKHALKPNESRTSSQFIQRPRRFGCHRKWECIHAISRGYIVF